MMRLSNLIENFFTLLAFCSIVFVSCASCTIHMHKYFPYKNNISKEKSYKKSKFYKSVARIKTIPKPGYKYKKKEGSTATAFAINKKNLMTVGHFCDHLINSETKKIHQDKIAVEGANDKGVKYFLPKARIIASELSKKYLHPDWCILETEEPHYLTPVTLLGDLELVETEDSITTIGEPKNRFPVRREGSVRTVTSTNIYLSVETQKGNSGSPVMWNGYVIGMVTHLDGYDKDKYPEKAKQNLNAAAIAARSDDLIDFMINHIPIWEINME